MSDPNIMDPVLFEWLTDQISIEEDELLELSETGED